MTSDTLDVSLPEVISLGPQKLRKHFFCPLQTTPTLCLPNPEKPFVQCVDEKDVCVTSVRLQKHGSSLKPVAYFSTTLDPVAKAFTHCLRVVGATERAVLTF